ncbi:hypothetical protein [Enterovibrio norvegicus]|uniref:hypothetical protein n=1 Tax=Enterovibrio norvegicus TaxID=188144 RepID=UPI0013D7EA43|nr:hypothetical protein [Enterovibrio norvegicus]
MRTDSPKFNICPTLRAASFYVAVYSQVFTIEANFSVLKHGHVACTLFTLLSIAFQSARFLIESTNGARRLQSKISIYKVVFM